MGARSARLNILVYHRVSVSQDPLRMSGVPAEHFDWQMRLLRRCFEPLPLGEAVVRLGEGRLPQRAVCVTFDDGYADNVEVALPILQRHGIVAAFFIATGFLDGGRMFNDMVIDAIGRTDRDAIDLEDIGIGRLGLRGLEERRRAVSRIIDAVKHLEPRERDERVARVVRAAGVDDAPQLMMRSAQVRDLAAAGMEVGGHTVSHPILNAIARDEARREIDEGRRRLEAIVQRSVTLFAYPNGKPAIDYARAHVDVVRELGFAAAVSTAWGSCDATSDRFQLPRFTPWDRRPAPFLARLIMNWRREPEGLV